MKRYFLLFDRRLAFDTAGALRHLDVATARGALRQIALDPSHHAGLRRLFLDLSPGARLDLLDHEELVAQLDQRLASGALRLVEDIPRGFRYSRDGDETEEPIAPFVEEEKKQESWIEIRLVDMESNPVPGARYEIKLPDGVVIDGAVDSEGKARVDGIDPGSCVISFPDLDADAWEPALAGA